jgi:hypothetical protein
MAITGAALQTALGTNGMSPQVMREYGTVSTFQEWLVRGGPLQPGRVRLIRTTAADNAATQAASVLTALIA